MSNGAYSDDELRRILGIGTQSTTPMMDAYNPYQSYGESLDFSNVGVNERGFRQEERNIWDRIFAPVTAPQQALYGLTTGMGIWESLSHGARYMNPWSNEGRITEDEVRETFFGSNAKGWAKGAQNLAIGVLFDPLMLAPVVKALGAPASVVRGVNLATNPIAQAAEVGKAAARVGTPLAEKAIAGVFGQEALEGTRRLATEVISGMFQRGYGAADGVLDEVRNAEAVVRHWYGEGNQVVKAADRLGPQAQTLLTEAMENQNVWLMRTGREITPTQLRAANSFEDRLLKEGLLPETFWAVYDRARKLDDDMGAWLLEQGIISSKQFDELRGTHIRRIYAAHENPTVFAERIEATLGTPLERPDRVYASADNLLRSMQKFGKEIAPDFGRIYPQPGMFEAGVEGAVDASRYFDNSGKFHAKNFTSDLLDYLNRESVGSVDEVFRHVRDNMLAGAAVPPKFISEIGNYMSGALQVWGSESLAKSLREGGMRAVMGQNAPQVIFKPFKENLDVVLRRQDLPDWVREALGEVMEFSPRMASQVTEVGGLIAARQLFQNLSGTKRVTAEAYELIQEANRLGLSTDDARALMQRAADDIGTSVDELAEGFDTIMREGPGTVVGTKGNRWASVERNDELGHRYQIPHTEAFGDMAGMWVDAGTHALLRGTDASATLASAAAGAAGGSQGQTAKALETLGNIYRDGVGAFKFMKAVADPTGQFRNFMGAAILANIAGFGFDSIKYLPKMVRETAQWVKDGSMGEYTRYMDMAGVNIFKNDMFSAEMRNLARRPLEAAMEGAGKKGFNWEQPFTSIIEAVNRASTHVPGVSRVADQLTGHTKSGIVDGFSASFQLGDQFWKLGMFMQKFDELRHAAAKGGKVLSDDVLKGFAQQAAAVAEQSIFNYADVPWLIKFTREWGVVPFITFPFKATPQVGRVLYSDPWRIVRYERLVDGINAMQVNSPEQVAEEIERLPQHMRDSMVVRLPWEDGQGRPQYLDLSYFMPWSVLQDIIEAGERDVGGFRSPLMRPPIMALYDGIVNNRDSLGRRVVDPNTHKTDVQKFEAMATYLITYMLPSWVPGQSRAQSWGRAMQSAARNDPSPVNWKDMLGTFSRDPMGALREAVGLGESYTREANARQTQAPAPHAQTTRTGVMGALSNLVVTTLGGATASNPPTQSAAPAQKMSAGELARRVARIRTRRDITMAEKNRLIRELRSQ